MERDYRQPSTGIQSGDRRLHHLTDGSQFIIDRDADRLKAPFCRMLLLPQGLGWHSGADHIHQLQRCINRSRYSAAADGSGNLGRIALLAVFVEDPP